MLVIERLTFRFSLLKFACDVKHMIVHIHEYTHVDYGGPKLPK